MFFISRFQGSLALLQGAYCTTPYWGGTALPKCFILVSTLNFLPRMVTLSYMLT